MSGENFFRQNYICLLFQEFIVSNESVLLVNGW